MARAMQTLPSTPQVTAWLSDAAGRPEAPTKQRPAAAPAHTCAHAAAAMLADGGAAEQARPRERRWRLLRLHLDQGAGAPRQQRRGRPQALNAARCKAAASAYAMPTHICSAVRAVGAAAT